MKMSFFRSVSTLMLCFSAHVVANNWEQERSEGQLGVTAERIDNLFNSVEKTGSTVTSSRFAYDWLGLYEGFGLHTPVRVNHNTFSGQSQLNATSYGVSPALQFFVTPSFEVGVHSVVSRDYLLAGDDNAEFALSNEQSEVRNQLVGVTMQIGHAPDLQNVTLDIYRQKQQRYQLELQQNEQLSRVAQLEYGVLFSENGRFLLSAGYRNEQVQSIDSQLVELGAGMSYRWTGAQEFKAIIGKFRRSQDDQSEQTGQFWQAANSWQLTSEWNLTAASSRHSLLSYALQTVSQLETQHELTLQYQPWQQHRFALSVQQRRIALEQQARERDTTQWRADWQWRLSDEWQLATSYKFRALDDSQWLQDVQQNVISLGVAWQW